MTSAPSICIVWSLTCTVYRNSLLLQKWSILIIKFIIRVFLHLKHQRVEIQVLFQEIFHVNIQWKNQHFVQTQQQECAIILFDLCVYVHMWEFFVCIRENVRETWMTLWAANLCLHVWKLTSTFSQDTRDRPVTSSSVQIISINKLVDDVASAHRQKKWMSMEMSKTCFSLLWIEVGKSEGN